MIGKQSKTHNDYKRTINVPQKYILCELLRTMSIPQGSLNGQKTFMNYSQILCSSGPSIVKGQTGAPPGIRLSMLIEHGIQLKDRESRRLTK